MHRHECLCFELVESAHRFFRIHVHFAREWRIVSADGQKRDLDVVAFANFFEALEISGIAAMKHGAPVRADYETAKAAMSIRKKASAPMMRGSERNFERTELDRLPFIQLVHNVESEPMDETAHAHWNDDRLIGRDEPQRAAIEMIEVRVSHEYEIDRRQMMNMKAGLLQSLDYFEPHRPDRIDQDIGIVRLNEKRGVPDPGDANLAGLHFGKERSGARAGAFRKQRRNPNAGDEIALCPIATGTQFYPGRFFRASVRRLANYLSLSRKRIRHSR